MTPAELKLRRKTLGLTQAQLAGMLEVPTARVGKWECGTDRIQHGKILDRALNDVGRELATLRAAPEGQG